MSKQRYSKHPLPLGQLVQRLTKPARSKRGLAHERILLEWPQIVGIALAAHAIPIKLSFTPNQQTGARLYVRCEPAWAMELQYLEPVILEKIALFFGYRAVEKLVIQQAALPAAMMPPRKLSTPASSNAPNPQLAQIEDDGLREALTRLDAARHRSFDT